MIVTRVIVLIISKSTYKKRQIAHGNTRVEPNFFFKKRSNWTCIQNRKRLTDVENKLMVTKGERAAGGINWELEMNRYTLLYIK